MNKQDEDKAKKIAEYINKPNGSNCFVQCHQAAMAMAAWKDEQLKQFLKDRYNKNLGSIKSWEAESIYEELFNEPISEQPMNF